MSYEEIRNILDSRFPNIDQLILADVTKRIYEGECALSDADGLIASYY